MNYYRFIQKNAPYVLKMHALKYSNIEPELKIINSFINKEKASIDAGANMGIYTYFMSKYSSQVYAYEPHPELCKYLELGVPSNVKVYGLGLSNKRDNTYLSVPILENGDENNGISRIGFQSTCVAKYTVDVIPLDEHNHNNVGFIKIDVEGHERLLIEGAEETIRKNKPVILIEIEQRYLEQSIYSIYDYIISLGYSGKYYYEGRLNNISKFRLDVHQNINNLGSNLYINNFIFFPR